MSQIIQILLFEEGYKERPYRDTEGFPTVGCGIKIGPAGAALGNYLFAVPRKVGEVWMQAVLDRQNVEMLRQPAIQAALRQCNPPRADVLCSMAYQLGTQGLTAFKQTLQRVADGDFAGAAASMLDSLWARQTPERARRHAEVMRSGTYESYQEVL
ncbi:glycoside hydrolase family protein [Erwinia persicina]|uniref:glycoside hydrolase family protein n=1 Tax=Erwinia persicina TaxID=55211 RepID=UPI0017817892|nr:glycoside hydrolase family protein [Erwinia persicina]MBD8165149.1 glycoside hydrolase family protein [Erwinia persicina]